MINISYLESSYLETYRAYINSLKSMEQKGEKLREIRKLISVYESQALLPDDGNELYEKIRKLREDEQVAWKDFREEVNRCYDLNLECLSLIGTSPLV